MFGLTNSEGNHGEDVKEYWFYLDTTPTHSYLKCLYKYPQRAFPYADLVATNGRRGKQDFEYELLDTGVFDDDRYFDVVVEYAKAAHDDILMLVTAHNRGPDAATLHLLPTLWFRNTWSWGDGTPKPVARGRRPRARSRRHAELGEWRLQADGASCCSATTRPTTSGCSARPTRARTRRTRSTTTSSTARDASTRRSGHQVRRPPRARDPGRRQRARSASGSRPSTRAGRSRSTAVFATRRAEADAFYATVIPPALDADRTLVMRQALAGLLWGKQYYEYDVHRWLREHGVNPWAPNAPATCATRRGSTWSPAT